MQLKKALVLGGAILLLAACSDATAPKPQLRTLDDTPAAAAKAPGKGGRTSTDGTVNDECRSGFSIRTGDREICVPELDQ